MSAFLVTLGCNYLHFDYMTQIGEWWTNRGATAGGDDMVPGLFASRMAESMIQRSNSEHFDRCVLGSALSERERRLRIDMRNCMHECLFHTQNLQISHNQFLTRHTASRFSSALLNKYFVHSPTLPQTRYLKTLGSWIAD